jgi:hypothetical protein
MERKTCEECEGRIVKKKVDYLFLGENLGKFPAEVCIKCGEQVFDEEVMDQITAITKDKGLWGLSKRAKIAKIGSSLGVTINKNIVDFLELHKGEEVTMYPESKKKLVIQVH